jgi:serine/threonine protein kinase
MILTFREIAKGLSYIHEKKLCHLHLSTKNIYLDENLTPHIADYGFQYLKDTSSIFIKYKNKNSYTSPELLQDTKSISNITIFNEKFEKCDIYSFGMILWELSTEIIPFNVKLATLIDLVLKDDYRPEITKEINKQVANLIRLCWDRNPDQRPKLSIIIEALNNIIDHQY